MPPPLLLLSGLLGLAWRLLLGLSLGLILGKVLI